MPDFFKTIPRAIELGNKGDFDALLDAFQMCKALEQEGATHILATKKGEPDDVVFVPENFTFSHTQIKHIRKAANRLISERKGGQLTLNLYYDCHLFDAPYEFDSYCIYLERDREPSKQFYLPRRKQLLPAVEALQDLADDKLDLLAISEPPGVGKALANDTPILTRKGWKNHGDLVVGDEVIGMNGQFKKVIAVHPKCQLDVLVEFTNGEKIQCHENHEWMTLDHARGNTRRTKETKWYESRALQFGEEGKRGHRYRFLLPLCNYIQGENKSLPIDPYVFGVWLGDGDNKNPRICNAVNDYAIIQEIIDRGYDVVWETTHKTTGVKYYAFDIRKSLQTYGLCHSRTRNEKYIPEDFLTASVKQRLYLLAGLIDTDGTRSGNKYTFTTCEEKLRDTFVDLVSTFGWRTCIARHKPSVSSSGIAGRKTTYCISFTPDCRIPCVLERKRNDGNVTQRRVAMKSISRVDPKEGNCITVEGDGMYLAGRKMIPTHNTTLAIFFLTWLEGRTPDLSILGGSHSNSFLRGVYEEIGRILDKDGEYRYKDVFPFSPVVRTNAKDMRIDLRRSKRFESFEFSSIGSGNAGKVRASNLLYCDDLVDGIETAMSKDRLDKLYQQYYTDLRQRKIGNCKELHIATRWSVWDVIGRLEMQYADDPRARFIKFAAVDEDGNSNFDYPYNLGFTTEFYAEQKSIMDDASWRALYMNIPIEREGRLYDPEEIRRYFDLPEREPDAIFAVCDTKEQGNDYAAMPIAFQYGSDYYIEKWICDNGKPDIIQERIATALCDYKVQLAQFESNRGGSIFAENVRKSMLQKGGSCRISTKWNEQNKETRIIVNSGWIKEHCLFKDDSVLKNDKEYRLAMSFLTGYTMSGKNPHDDVPDVLADLAVFAQGFGVASAKIMKRPF